MLLPLDGNGKIPSSVLPQASQIPVTTINGVDATSGNIDLVTNTPTFISITPNDATDKIAIDFIGTGIGGVQVITVGPGLMGGGSGDSVHLFIKPNGITSDMLGTGVVTGIKLDQFIAGNGLYQDNLGNLHIGYNSTLEIVGDLLGINLANPNTWTGLQTFNAGITVNGPVQINGVPEPNATTDPVGVASFEEILIGDLRVAGFTYLQGNTRINGIADLRNDIVNTGGDVTVNDNLHVTGNTDLDGTLNVDGLSTTNGIDNTGDINNMGNFNQTGDINNTGNITNVGDISQTGNISQSAGNVTFAPGITNTVSIFGNPFGAAANAASQPTEWDLLDDGDFAVTGFSWLMGNTQMDMNLSVAGNTDIGGNTTIGGNTMIGGTLGVTGATTLGDDLSVAGNSTLTGDLGVGGNTSLTGTLNVGGASTFNGITNNGTLTQNGVSTFNATLNVTGPNVTNLGGALNVTGLTTTTGLTNNGTFTQNGASNMTGNVTLVGNLTQTGNTSITGTLSNTGNVNLASNPGTINTFGGSTSANRFNGTSNFGTLPATNGNKLIIDGVANLGVPVMPSGFPAGFNPATDFEGVVNGDFQVTGFTHLNNATVNGTLVIMGGIVFPPAATACLNTIQVQNLTSWCGGPAGASINLGTAFSQSSLGTSASNTFMATTVTGVFTQSGGNASITGGAANSFGTGAGAANSFGNGTGTNTFSGNSTFNNTVTIQGATQVNNTLGVTGATTLGSTLTVAGHTQLNNTMTTTGAAVFQSTVDLQGAVSNTTANNGGSVHINDGLNVVGILDAQNQIVNTTGNDGGRVQVNDGFHVNGTTSNTALDGDANTFGLTGRPTVLVANPVAINPPTLNETTPTNTNSFRGHSQFIGTAAGLNERKVFIHGVPEGPGAVVPNNTVPPVTNFEVEIVGDLYVQGTIVGGGIPQVASYTMTLVPGTGPNGGGSASMVVPTGVDNINDAVHMDYTNFGTAQGFLVWDIPAANTLRIESSSALDNANVRVTIIRYP
jgi:predicted acyltransferase (DUF342 family)